MWRYNCASFCSDETGRNADNKATSKLMTMLFDTKKALAQAKAIMHILNVFIFYSVLFATCLWRKSESPFIVKIIKSMLTIYLYQSSVDYLILMEDI